MPAALVVVFLGLAGGIKGGGMVVWGYFEVFYGVLGVLGCVWSIAASPTRPSTAKKCPLDAASNSIFFQKLGFSAKTSRDKMFY